MNFTCFYLTNVIKSIELANRYVSSFKKILSKIVCHFVKNINISLKDRQKYSTRNSKI